MDIRLHNTWTVGGSTRQWCPKINGRPCIFVRTFLCNYIDKNESLSLWEWKFGEKNAMYSATIDLVAECQKWLRNVAYVKTDGRTDGQTDGRGALQYLPSRASGTAGDKNGGGGGGGNSQRISSLSNSLDIGHLVSKVSEKFIKAKKKMKEQLGTAHYW